ncbi:MAG: polysaccharide deacetylase family protein, partial [Flavisolibacter sp.]|nr:polysaccharide deacetylase family protein [Flavisolibacter sp.]
MFYTLWDIIEERLKKFLAALEMYTHTYGLTRSTLFVLERKALQHTQLKSSLTVGATHGMCIEITSPLPDVHPPAVAERLICVVEMEGKNLGEVELPVYDGLVPTWLLKDAVAAQFAWQILGKFFENTVYKRQLSGGENDDEGFAAQVEEVHNRIGWTVFLQQLWGRPDWPADRFYDAQYLEENMVQTLEASALPAIEVSAGLPAIEMADEKFSAIFTAGGVAVGVIHLSVSNNTISPQAIRVAITTAGGFELCRVCVREALIGKPFNSTSLRERLAQAAEQRATIIGIANVSLPFLPGENIIILQSLVLGRRTGLIGSSVSRRALLPIGAAGALIKMVQAANETIEQLHVSDGQPDHILYMPEFIQIQPAYTVAPTPERAAKEPVNVYGRHHFETLFSKNPDPWEYTHPYEQNKYKLTLSLLPEIDFSNALELACAEGIFTAQLAPHVKKLTAADISRIALQRAAERCHELKHVHFALLDLVKDALPKDLDLIVCSEVLYYVGDLENLKTVAEKFLQALVPGGYLLMTHSHQVIDEPDKPGFDWGLPFGAKVIGDTFTSLHSLYLIKEIRTSLFRVQLFQREKRFRRLDQQITPEIKVIDQLLPVKAAVAPSVRWQGGQPSEAAVAKPVTTQKLPILMYHSVDPKGETRNRYCIHPQSFEEQLQYLRDSGYYCATLNDWSNAATARRPLPGLAVIITFDDAYLDFYHHAWPLLKKYGFTATVFLVADHIGKTASWLKPYNKEVPLMRWEEIRRLRDEGVEFGSHSATHRALTALSSEDIVLEGATSRTIIQSALGIPVKT